MMMDGNCTKIAFIKQRYVGPNFGQVFTKKTQYASNSSIENKVGGGKSAVVSKESDEKSPNINARQLITKIPNQSSLKEPFCELRASLFFYSVTNLGRG